MDNDFMTFKYSKCDDGYKISIIIKLGAKGNSRKEDKMNISPNTKACSFNHSYL